MTEFAFGNAPRLTYRQIEPRTGIPWIQGLEARARVGSVSQWLVMSWR